MAYLVDSFPIEYVMLLGLDTGLCDLVPLLLGKSKDALVSLFPMFFSV